MQDSLEDYIRISRNCKEGPTQVRKEVNAQIEKECNAKAMQILHFAIEGKMRSDTLFHCLQFINPAHYQDIVEERAITKLCGYPLCSKHIPEMPKKQFFISTKSNKVYDITERKNYCSNFCYRASHHILKQIDTSPLWLRQHNQRPRFTLLDKAEKGWPGKVVDQGVGKTSEDHFTSVSSFAQMSLDEAEEFELKPEEEEVKVKKPFKFQKKTMKTINEDNEEEVKAEYTAPKKEDKIEAKVREKEEQKEDVATLLRRTFKEWLTLETFILINGEAKVKEKLTSEKLDNYFEQLRVAELQLEQKKRYVDICRKLHLKELADLKFDKIVIGSREFGPIPDYQELKEENRALDVKVKKFYSGELTEQEVAEKKEEGEENASPAVLPLVDVHSQNALRRKIFLNSLNKTVQTLCQTLKLSPSLILPDLQALVKTFQLRAENIVFKPLVWKYVVIILIRILALKDENFRQIVEECTSEIKLVLSSLSNSEDVICDVLNMVKNEDDFIANYITCT